MKNEIFDETAKSFANSDVEYVGENDNIVLYKCIVDGDGMAMFVVIPKDTMKPEWTNGIDEKWLADFSDIMSRIPDDDRTEDDDEPLFLQDPSWYMFDDNGKIILTTKAPPEAVDSYFEWLADNPR